MTTQRTTPPRPPLITVRRLLRHRGHSQVWLAGALGVHETLVSHHLHGRRNYARYLDRYAAALGVPIEIITPEGGPDA